MKTMPKQNPGLFDYENRMKKLEEGPDPFDQGPEEEESEEEPDTGEGGAYLWVYDKHDEGRIKDEVDRDETDCGGHRTVKSRLQRGAVRKIMRLKLA